MKRLLLLSLLVPALAAAGGPDEDRILDRTMDAQSAFYYPALMMRYNAGDETLTDEDYHYLYYGYAYRDEYKPLAVNPDLDKMLMLASGIDPDKPDQTTTTLLRLNLAYADSVEDAVALVEQYDLHASTNCVFHYMVADSTGRSAILEWVGSDADHDSDGSQRRLNVLWNDPDSLSDSADWQVVTNFIKAPGYYDGTAVEMKGLDRYEHLAAALRQSNGGVADKYAAMDLLASAGRRTWNNDDSNSLTVHSAVYNLTDKTVLRVGNEHYGEDGRTFRYSLQKYIF